MSKITVVLNRQADLGDTAPHDKVISVEGSRVFVGEEEINRIVNLRLEAPLPGVWKLCLEVIVNPAELFEYKEVERKSDSSIQSLAQFIAEQR